MASHHINKGRRHFANRLPVQGAQPVHRSTTVGSSLVTARLSTPTHSYTHNRQHTSSARHTYPACRSQCKVLRNANAATNKGGKTKKNSQGRATDSTTSVPDTHQRQLRGTKCVPAEPSSPTGPTHGSWACSAGRAILRVRSKCPRKVHQRPRASHEHAPKRP